MYCICTYTKIINTKNPTHFMASEKEPAISSRVTDYGATTSLDFNSVVDIEQNFNAQRFGSLPWSGDIRGYQSSTKDPLLLLSYRMGVDTESAQMVHRLEYFVNVLSHVCIGFVTIYMSWLCLRINLAGTALHAWLVTIGFCFLMAEAVMCHYTGNVLTFNLKRTTKTTIHWVLQVLGGGLGVAGSLIKLIQKGFLLKSIHGKLGFAAFLLCLLSMTTGLSALYSMRFKRLLNPLLNKTFHVSLGLATFVLAMAAQFYGYETGFFRRKVSEDFQILMQCITLSSMFLCSIGPLQALYQKTRNIIKNFN